MGDCLRVPAADSRPATVASSQLKNVAAELKTKRDREERIRRERTQAKNNIRSRLMELTAIYSQNLVPSNVKQKVLKSKKKAGEGSSGSKAEDDDDEGASSKSKRSIKLRDWINPIKKCGGWVRVFPFDDLSHYQSRGKMAVDTKVLVNHIYRNLKKARQITLDNPLESDEAYAAALKAANNLTTEVWIPPGCTPQN